MGPPKGCCLLFTCYTTVQREREREERTTVFSRFQLLESTPSLCNPHRHFGWLVQPALEPFLAFSEIAPYSEHFSYNLVKQVGTVPTSHHASQQVFTLSTLHAGSQWALLQVFSSTRSAPFQRFMSMSTNDSPSAYPCPTSVASTSPQ